MARRASLLSSALLVLALSLIGSLGIAALGGPAALLTGAALPRLGAPAQTTGGQGGNVTVDQLRDVLGRDAAPNSSITAVA